jgi:hypothetical protein
MNALPIARFLVLPYLERVISFTSLAYVASPAPP